MSWRFLLSHHPPEHHHRCVRIGGLPVCARCLGLYPVMLAVFVAALMLHGQGAAWLDPMPGERWALMALCLPALLDWLRGKFRPHAGSNLIRALTGALLGIALGRTLYLNARAPLEPPARDVLIFLAVAVVAGEAVYLAYRDDSSGSKDAPPG